MAWKGFGRIFTDEIIEKQCRYCKFYKPKGEWSCGVLTYCEIDMVTNIEGDHCKSFYPETMFGICRECEHQNPYKPTFYCDCKEQPNRRVVYDRSDQVRFELYTCDNYRVACIWKKHILENLKKGRCPANFDHETWQPIEEWQKDGVLAKIEQIIAEDNEKQWTGPGEFKQLSIFEKDV